MRSRNEYREQKRQRIAETNLSILRMRVKADKKLLKAMWAVLTVAPSHKLLRMPSPVKKSTKHVVMPHKVTNYDANPELVSQTGKTRTLYLEVSEEVAQFALGLSLEDRKLFGVQTVKVEWTQEDALHFLWRMRQWYEWLLDTWRLCNQDHMTFVDLLTTSEQYGGQKPKEVKPKKAKLVEGAKATDAMNRVVVSYDTLAGWEWA